MAREEGTFGFSANFEVAKKGTIDARQMVDNFADLLAFTAENFIDNGFPVSVRGVENSMDRGLYVCDDVSKLNEASSWVRLRGKETRLNEIGDIYIGTQNENTKLLYLTDQYREIDLQPFVTATIVNTNIIERDNNDLYVVGNFSFVENPIPIIVLKITNVRFVSNRMFFDSITEATIEGFTSGHCLRVHGDFLYVISRPLNNVAKILKIAKNNFSDQKQILLSDFGYPGSIHEIEIYRNKIYTLINKDGTSTADQIKTYFLEIDENLNTVKEVFNLKYLSADLAFTDTMPFAIYNGEVYFMSFSYNDWTIGLEVWGLDGTRKRSVQGLDISLGEDLTWGGTPHWIGIFNGKLICNLLYTFRLVRIDIYTLQLEEVIELGTSVTDENTILSNGYMFLNGEYNPFLEPNPLPAHLLKIYYKDFTDFNIEIANASNGKGLYGSLQKEEQREFVHIPKKVLIDGEEFLLKKGYTNGVKNTEDFVEVNDLALDGIFVSAANGNNRFYGSLKCIDNTGLLTTAVDTKWEFLSGTVI